MAFKHSGPEANPGSGSLEAAGYCEGHCVPAMSTPGHCWGKIPGILEPLDELGSPLQVVSLARSLLCFSDRPRLNYRTMDIFSRPSLYFLPFSANFVSSAVPPCWPCSGESAQKFLFKYGSFLQTHLRHKLSLLPLGVSSPHREQSPSPICRSSIGFAKCLNCNLMIYFIRSAVL